MPLYEYQCKKCGHRFELIQSFSAEDPKECPVCHSEVERLISTPARPQFKGSGFYTTDYAAKPAAAGKSSDGSSSDGSSTSSDKAGTADKAPAAKTESAPAPASSSSSTKSE
jgi:putative FmdB family regulatory protein